MRGVQAIKVAKYLLLPGIIPRVRNLFASGFGYIAYLMASIYGMVRLLPPGHPYLNPRNIGKFGIRHAIGEAANNLVLRRRNIDQIVIFLALLAGIVILVLQFLLLIYGYVVQPALAMSMFNTPNPTNDIAFVLMDKVFGVPGVFCNNAGDCTSVAAGGGDWRLPFHKALHGMFQFYSLGLLLVGVVIFLYFVVVVIAETAASGTPFGQRFDNIWVPIRLVVALGLLVPIHYGLNTGQYLTLYAAKMGSGFATNGWLRFNQTLASSTTFSGGKQNPSGERDAMLALPNSPDISPVVQFMSFAHACAYGYWKQDQNFPPKKELDLFTKSNLELVADEAAVPPHDDFYIKPYLTKKPESWMTINSDPRLELTETTSYTEAVDFYNNGDIIIRFGRYGEGQEKYKKYTGEVEPSCGEIRVHINDLRHKGQGATVGGADYLQEFYFKLIQTMWFNAGNGGEEKLFKQVSQRYMDYALKSPPSLVCKIGCSNPHLPSCPVDCNNQQPDGKAKQHFINYYQAQLDAAIQTAWAKYNADPVDIEISNAVLERGWGGAGIWYNTIADINGSFIGAAIDIPSGTKYAKVMEDIRMARARTDADVNGLDQFCPNIAGNNKIEIEGGDDAKNLGKALCDFYNFWNKDGANMAAGDKVAAGNPVETFMHMVFGTGGLFAIRGKNAHIHPLAQLAAVGKSLVDSAVLNIAASTGFAVMGGVFSKIAEGIGVAADIIGSIASTVTFIGLTAGFVLFYILPFLPFVYFFFAVSSWLMTIFEAMVGVPLWALAHLRLDGEGLPGDAASPGYFMLFEIFIRPILSVFSLIAALVIFTAQVRVLNFIWDLVVGNLTGYDANAVVPILPMDGAAIPRGVIDQFFFTLVYTVIVYMLATASFKLIDKIPDGITRWMGAGISTFGDINNDPTESLTKYAALGGLTLGQSATGAIRDFGRQAGNAVGGEFSKLQNLGK